MIATFFVDDDTGHLIEEYSIICTIFHIIENIMHILSLGPQMFFNDGWHQFDFFLNLIGMISYIFVFDADLPIGVIKGAVQLIKVRRFFRIAKTIRTFKILNFFFISYEIFQEVKSLLHKIFILVPIFIRLLVMQLMIFYIFSVIGVELFNDGLDTFNQNGNP